MKTFNILVLFAWFSSILGLKSFDENIQLQIDNIIENIFMPVNHIPGLGLGIVNNQGDIVLAKGYGERDIGNALASTNETKFCIASITKTFTSTLVVKVLNEKYPELGETVLDIPIRRLLPVSNFTFSDRYRSESISFRDLMSHRHCLRTDNLGMGSGAFKDGNDWAYRTRYAPSVCEFRSNAWYSNGMYNLIGKLIGEVAESSYETLLQDLLDKIGMTESSFVKESEDYDLLPNMSKGYFRKDDKWEIFNPELYKRITVATPGGGVLSTPSDMTKYMLFHLNYGKVGSQQIVSESAMRWLYKPAVPLSFLATKASDSDIVTGMYSLGTGFVLGIYDEWKFASFNGDWAPFLSAMTLFPDANLGIFTTTNGPGHISDPITQNYLHEKIFDILLGNNRSTDVSQRTKPEKHRKIVSPNGTHTKADVILKTLATTSRVKVEPETIAGIYGNPVEGEFNIIHNPNGTLYIQYGKWATGYLLPYLNSSTIVSIEWDSDIVHEFYAAGGTPDAYIDFSEENKAGLIIGGERIDFIKNATLDTLPEIPWDPESC